MVLILHDQKIRKPARKHGVLEFNGFLKFYQTDNCGCLILKLEANSFAQIPLIYQLCSYRQQLEVDWGLTQFNLLGMLTHNKYSLFILVMCILLQLISNPLDFVKGITGKMRLWRK